jgi:hypothetical protein
VLELNLRKILFLRGELMLLVKSPGLGAQQPLHARPEVEPWHFGNPMKMVSHQAIDAWRVRPHVT